MKILRILALAVAAGSCIAAEPTWNPADAVKEAEQDIRTGHIKFYWSGSIASMPVGVPFEVAKKYPQRAALFFAGGATRFASSRCRQERMSTSRGKQRSIAHRSANRNYSGTVEGVGKKVA